MESEWAGDSENAFFSADKFDSHRQIMLAEEERKGAMPKDGYYIIAADVGRKGCATEAIVFKVYPQVQGVSQKSIVNLYSLENEHFEVQAMMLKDLYYKYQAKALVVDANGLGIGLVDYLVKPQSDVQTGKDYPDFGIANDDDKFYAKFKTESTEEDAVYLIKANATLNTEAYANAQTQLSSGKIKFLIDEGQAKMRLMDTKVGQKMTSSQRNDYLRPYVMTSILKEQLCNLAEDNNGVNIILKQIYKNIPKDKFSAFIYGLLYIKRQDDHRGKRKRRLSDFMFGSFGGGAL